MRSVRYEGLYAMKSFEREKKQLKHNAVFYREPVYFPMKSTNVTVFLHLLLSGRRCSEHVGVYRE